MLPETAEFKNDRQFVRRAQELKTLKAMIRLYCRGHGHARQGRMCDDCAALLDYAGRRLRRCVFGDAKPTCANCLVHCYTAEMRERVRQVMRWAGPRMLYRHPLIAVRHVLDGRRPALKLPPKPLR
ncbi:MAG: nitrous oxide-stimulated promoter family protein [Burkholderiales bacterium]